MCYVSCHDHSDERDSLLPITVVNAIATNATLHPHNTIGALCPAETVSLLKDVNVITAPPKRQVTATVSSHTRSEAPPPDSIQAVSAPAPPEQDMVRALGSMRLYFSTHTSDQGCTGLITYEYPS